MYTIPTLHQFKRHMDIDPQTTTQDDRLLLALEAATRLVEQHTLRRYLPYREARDHSVDAVYPRELVLSDDLLELIAVVDADGQIDPDEIALYPSRGPASLLRLTMDAFAIADTPVTVTGMWGYHPQPPLMWGYTGDSVQDDPLTEAATTITVSDANAVYADGITPRFSVGALLSIDEEMVRVTAVDTATNSLTVMRGVQGTTATQHAQNTPIEAFHPAYDVLMGVMRIAAVLYHEPDVAKSEGFPPDLRRTLAHLRRHSVMV